MSERIPLAEYFVKTGMLNEHDLHTLQSQQQQGGFFAHTMVMEGWIRDQQLYTTLSKMRSISCEVLDSLIVEREILQLIPQSVAIRFKVMPLFIHENMLYLAMENPSDIEMLQRITSRTGMQIKPLLAAPQQLRSTIEKYYSEGDDIH